MVVRMTLLLHSFAAAALQTLTVCPGFLFSKCILDNQFDNCLEMCEDNNVNKAATKLEIVMRPDSGVLTKIT